MLQELFALPDSLLDTEADALAQRLGAPTLIHLPGVRQPALFISVLMHGNEIVGWDAARRLLRHYQRPSGLELPRAVSLFIGTVQAAAHNLRRLPEQPDYNRVWPGGEAQDSPEGRMMRQVLDIMARRGVFASVDVHNNTGVNPHYACINELDRRFLRLANLFGRVVVYFRQPRGVQSMAMARLCPSVTLECGKVRQQQGMEHALEYLDACLHLQDIPTHGPAAHDIDLFHTVAQVKLPADLSLAVDEGEADLVLPADLDRLNFRELPAGTSFGRVRDGVGLRIEARDEQGGEVTERYFELADGELRVKVPVMPSMLTLDQQVIRQDCLGYLMERYNDHMPG
jgi:hypothetical protein